VYISLEAVVIVSLSFRRNRRELLHARFSWKRRYSKPRSGEDRSPRSAIPIYRGTLKGEGPRTRVIISLADTARRIPAGSESSAITQLICRS